MPLITFGHPRNLGGGALKPARSRSHGPIARTDPSCSRRVSIIARLRGLLSTQTTVPGTSGVLGASSVDTAVEATLTGPALFEDNDGPVTSNGVTVSSDRPLLGGIRRSSRR